MNLDDPGAEAQPMILVADAAEWSGWLPSEQRMIYSRVVETGNEERLNYYLADRDAPHQPQLLESVPHGPGMIEPTFVGASDDENRKAVFKLVSGAKAFVTYEPKSLPAGVDDPKAKAELRGKKLEMLNTGAQKEDCGKNDKSCVEISIFKDGGNLTFECAGDQPCRVELK